MAWSKTTRLAIACNVALTVLVAFVLLVMANAIAKKYYHRWDLTRDQAFRLSDQTLSLLREMARETKAAPGGKNPPSPVLITTFFSASNPLFVRVKDLLDEYQAVCPALRVEHIDPERDHNKAVAVLKALKKESAQMNDILVLCGENSRNISERDLGEVADGGMGGEEGVLKVFKGEEAVTGAILSVRETRTWTVYFTQGHGEPDPEAAGENGYRRAADLLKRENFRVEKISLAGKQEVPQDCQLLLIAAPARSFLKEELALLSGYLKRGGKLFALINPSREPLNLEGFFREYGVELGRGMVFDPAGRLLLADVTTFATSAYGIHPIVDKLQGVITIFNAVRPLQLTASPAGRTVVELVKTSEQGWADNNVEENAKQNKITMDVGVDKPGPVTIMAAVSAVTAAAVSIPDPAAAGEAKPEGPKPSGPGFRLVVAGDATFVQTESPGNVDLFLNAVNWLVQKENRITIRPRKTDEHKLVLGPDDLQRIFGFSFLGLPFLALVVGGMVWFFRRQ